MSGFSLHLRSKGQSDSLSFDFNFDSEHTESDSDKDTFTRQPLWLLFDRNRLLAATQVQVLVDASSGTVLLTDETQSTIAVSTLLTALLGAHSPLRFALTLKKPTRLCLQGFYKRTLDSTQGAFDLTQLSAIK